MDNRDCGSCVHDDLPGTDPTCMECPVGPDGYLTNYVPKIRPHRFDLIAATLTGAVANRGLPFTEDFESCREFARSVVLLADAVLKEAERDG